MKNIKSHVLYILAAILVMSIACRKEETAKKEEECILLAYLAGDNNLSWDASEKLAAMEAGWNRNIHGKLVVYIDAQGQEQPQLIEIYSDKAGKTQRKVIKDYPQQNSASKEVMSNIIQTVKSRYSAKQYNLLVFSHGTGWLPYNTLGTRSVINDNHQEMELADLKQAIPDHAFHNIIFEACYMASVEVSYALKDKADNIFASSAEIVAPGFTETYKTHLNLLFQDDLSNFGREAFLSQENGATFSLIKTATLPELAAFLKEHSTESIGDTNNIQTYTTGGFNKWIFDFSGYYSKTLSSKEEYADFQKLVNKCITWKATTSTLLKYDGGFDINLDNFSGLTSYIQGSNRPSINKAYTQTDWYHAITK